MSVPRNDDSGAVEMIKFLCQRKCYLIGGLDTKDGISSNFCGTRNCCTGNCCGTGSMGAKDNGAEVDKVDVSVLCAKDPEDGAIS